jgi:adenosylmethionine-8-amino-7-oxononanoate aminotransferase
MRAPALTELGGWVSTKIRQSNARDQVCQTFSVCPNLVGKGMARLGELQDAPAGHSFSWLGLLIGVEPTSPTAAERAMYRSLELGLSFKVTVGTILTLTPPLTISGEEMDDAVGILDRAVEGLSREPLANEYEPTVTGLHSLSRGRWRSLRRPSCDPRL